MGLLAALAGLLVAGTAVLEAQNPQPSASAIPRPVIETHELMELFNRPLYQRLKEEMQQQPADQDAWATLSQRGLQTAEVANLVALRKDQQQWRQLAADLQRAGIQFSEAAKGENWPATQMAYRSLLQRCNACHQTMAPDHAPQLQP